ncbi:unnamed protein product [Linum trigynum]|uniref:Uncharacterized protein n=1 Tax=Linum trigynum TaxID=586398 RepID=A0AAV2DR74_9ROSI
MVSAFAVWLPWYPRRRQPSQFGSSRKIILEMAALQAAFLAKQYSPRPNNPAVFTLLISLSITVYAYIKFCSVALYIDGLNIIDVSAVAVAVAQSLIYSTPYWGSIVSYLFFVGYRFWAVGSEGKVLIREANDEKGHMAGVVPAQVIVEP